MKKYTLLLSLLLLFSCTNNDGTSTNNSLSNSNTSISFDISSDDTSNQNNIESINSLSSISELKESESSNELTSTSSESNIHIEKDSFIGGSLVTPN